MSPEFMAIDPQSSNVGMNVEGQVFKEKIIKYVFFSLL